MLSAASRTCALDGRSSGEEKVLDLVHMATALDQVEGQSFPDFLASAVDRMRQAAETLVRDPAVAPTLVDIYKCKPRDIVGEIFDELVDLASMAYKEVLQESLDVPLDRTVAFEGPEGEGFHVSGRVPSSRQYVMLVMYTRAFDLRSLALVPRILAHELICHVGARHLNIWQRTPNPDFRSFFSDGFMDCAAWRLLMQWIDVGALARFTSAGHLFEAESPYAQRRPHVFHAGRGAWANCDTATKGRMLDGKAPAGRGLAQLRAEAEEAVLRAALELNGTNMHIEPKDRFAYRARMRMAVATDRFVDVATGVVAASGLLAEMHEGDD